MKKAIIITFLVATSMAYNQVLSQEEAMSLSPQQSGDVPAAVYDHELVHHMTRQRVRFLQNCTDKLSTKCGMEMTEGLANKKPVSEGCCKNILMLGRDCHEGLMNFAISTYELKDIGYEILAGSKRIWNQCVQTTASRIGAPLAFET